MNRMQGMNLSPSKVASIFGVDEWVQRGMLHAALDQERLADEDDED